MAERAGATITEVGGSHVAMVSHPQVTIDAILAAASAVGEGKGTVGRRGWVHRHDLPLFFVLAFLLSWLAWPLVILNPESSPLLPFGPARSTCRPASSGSCEPSARLVEPGGPLGGGGGRRGRPWAVVRRGGAGCPR
jgi:hypothetical protein